MASAIVGTLRVLLEANASKLESEFGKATIKIGEFDKFTQNAGRNLQRMVEQFSGQKIVAEAARMAAAVEKVGGVSTLTERELRRVASTVEEASNKLRAMGAEVPPSIAKLKTEIDGLGVKSTQTTGSVSSLTGALRVLGPILPIASVAGLATAIIRIGTAAINAAGEIEDLSQKTGLSADAIQRMRAVAKDTGTTVDAFTNAVFKLGINIAEGTGKARAAIHALGLSFDEIRAMKPEDQFHAVVRALEGVTNAQEQHRLGTSLFGKQFSEIAAGISQGYSKIADDAATATDEQIKALARAGDAWSKFLNAVTIHTAAAGGEIVRTIDGIVTALGKISQFDPILLFGAAGLFNKGPVDMLIAIGQGMAKMGDAAEDAKPKIAAAGATNETYIQQLEKVRRSLLDLSHDQRNQIEAALKLKKSNEEIAAAFDLSEEAVELYRQQMDKVPGSTKKASDEIAKAAKVQRDFNNWIGERYIAAEAMRQEAAAKSENQLRDFYNWLGQRRMEDDAALMNSTRILATYSAAWVPLRSAIEQTLPKMEDATQKAKRLKEANEQTSTSLRTLAQAFANLSQIAGEGGLGNLLKQLGEIVAAVSLMRDGLDAVDKGLDNFNTGNITAGFAQMATGIMGVVAAMEAATRGTNKWKSALGGAAVGGSVGGVWGAIIGFTIGWIRAGNEAEKQQRALEAQIRKTALALREQANAMTSLIDLFELRDDLDRMFENVRTEEDLERIREELDRIAEAGRLLNSELSDLFDLMNNAGFAIPPEMELFFDSFMNVLDPVNKAKLEGLLGVLGDMEVPWQKMQQAAEKFGIDIGSLGQKFQGAKLKASAKEIIDAFEMLTKNGADVGGVLFGMKDEISALVQDAKKFGTDIPAQMKPWIEELLRAGHLVDENGDALTDLGGIKFGAPIVSEFDKIIKKIDALIDRFAELAGVIGSLPKVPGDIVPDPGTPFNPDFPTEGPRERFPGGTGSQLTAPPIFGSSAALAGAGVPGFTMPVSSGLRIPGSDVRVPQPSIADRLPPNLAVNVDAQGEPRIYFMPVIYQKDVDESEIRETVATYFADDLAGDRQGMRRRTVPIISQSVIDLLNGMG